jgi:Protein of unknown function (DUF2793)
MPTPRFGLPYIAQGQAQKDVSHNEALNQLDAVIDLHFLARDLAASLASPTDGDTLSHRLHRHAPMRRGPGLLLQQGGMR